MFFFIVLAPGVGIRAEVTAVSIRAEVTAQTDYVTSILDQVELFVQIKQTENRYKRHYNYVMLF